MDDKDKKLNRADMSIRQRLFVESFANTQQRKALDQAMEPSPVKAG